MVTKIAFTIVSCIVAFTLMACATKFSAASPALTIQGCGPEEMGAQSKYRNLCLFYNGLLKQQAYENYKYDLPMNRFIADAENSQSDMMLLPSPGETHYTNGGVKRQDVDHVFLRFGRRR